MSTRCPKKMLHFVGHVDLYVVNSAAGTQYMAKNTEQGSLETLFVYIYHRLYQAGNKCKQMNFDSSLLRITCFRTTVFFLFVISKTTNFAIRLRHTGPLSSPPLYCQSLPHQQKM